MKHSFPIAWIASLLILAGCSNKQQKNDAAGQNDSIGQTEAAAAMDRTDSLKVLETVDYLQYTNKQNYLEVYHLKHTPRATIMEMTAYCTPGNWIQLNDNLFLKGCQTGKVYRLQKSVGFNLNSKVTMPASGTCTFNLYFEPVDATDRAVHCLKTPQDTLFSHLCVRNMPHKEGTFACRLQGTVLGEEPCVRLLVTDPLYKKGLKLWKSIPVHDKKFDYTFYTDHPQVVHLTKWEEYDRSEGWYQIPFFIEEGSNHADVSEQDGKLILHKGTALNREWEKHCKQLKKIGCKRKVNAIYDRMNEMSPQETYTPEAMVVYAQLDSLFTANKSRGFSKKEARLRNELFEQIEVLRKANKLYSAAYLALQRQADYIEIEMEKAALDYFGDHAPTLAGLYYLEEKVYAYTHNDKKNDRYLLPYTLYRKHFIRQWKDNPLAKNIESMVDAKQRFKVGEKYLPYQADDLNSKAVSVDKVIRGKWHWLTCGLRGAVLAARMPGN